MKPSVIANANASANSSAGNGANDISQSTNGINIPINHEYGVGGNMQQPSQQYYAHGQQHPHPQQPHLYTDGYGSPRTQQYAQQPHQSQQHQIPSHFQQFGFEPDVDVDMFPRSRLGRMHDPFAGFGSARKRSSFHDPQNFANDDFSRYFDDDPDFGFPQFSTLGRRRAGGDPMADDHDFFNRLPSEFRQFMPEGFPSRRTGGVSTAAGPGPSGNGSPQTQPGQGYYQTNYIPSGSTPPTSAGVMTQSPSKKLCDAAIQTEDPNVSQGRSEVDSHHQPSDNLNHHGLRNTVDMGVKSAAENEMHGPRSHSAPPPEQQQQNQQHMQQQHQHQQQKIPINGKRNTPPPSQGQNVHMQYGPPPPGGFQHQPSSSYYQKSYYPPHQQAHPQQKQQTPPPPQTPGGSYVRTIPIFVEGRQEPIINSHKEIPNQNGSTASASASASARAFTPPHQQQQTPRNNQQQSHSGQPQPHPQPQQQHHHNRPTPLNTQQQQPHNQTQQQQQQGQQPSSGLPPQTPHTMDSINKIQDIQRDVLELMAQVEQFKGTRQDKEYVYLDEMLTRNLLKLDTIDTNGKESIRLARKEAIKCIQASINVLEAKAEENLRALQGKDSNSASSKNNSKEQSPVTGAAAAADASVSSPKNSQDNIAAKAAHQDQQQNEPTQPSDATQIQEPIPLPPPESMQQQESDTTNNLTNSDANNSSSPQGAQSSIDTPNTSSNNESSAAESSNSTIESK